MLERSRRARFRDQRQCFFFRHRLGDHPLDGDFAVKRSLARQPHCPHPASTEQRDQLEVGIGFAQLGRGERQTRQRNTDGRIAFRGRRLFPRRDERAAADRLGRADVRGI
jgi:hypothetical protein